MAKLEILEFPDPRLRTVAKPVETVDDALRKLIDDMIETMRDANGAGGEELVADAIAFWWRRFSSPPDKPVPNSSAPLTRSKSLVTSSNRTSTMPSISVP